MIDNEKKPPLLSLCVPTYRRAELLKLSLHAILSQIKPEITEKVEVLVLDNASPDETPQVVAEATADFPHVFLRSFRHQQNIGGDANFFEAVKLAEGDFIYLLSDDDVLLPGAVQRLLELIAAYPDFDAFSLNVRLFTEDPQEEGTPQTYNLSQDRILRSRDDILLLLKAHIVFLSCIAFRRTTVQARDYQHRCGTQLSQAYMFLDALAPGRGVYTTRQAYLAQRTDNAEGYNFYRVWVTNFHGLMRYARQIGYSAPVVQEVLKENLRFLFHYAVVFKTRGQYGDLRINYPDALLRLLRTYGFNGYLWTRIIPVLLTPRFAIGLLRGLYRSLKSLRPDKMPQNPVEKVPQ